MIFDAIYIEDFSFVKYLDVLALFLYYISVHAFPVHLFRL